MTDISIHSPHMLTMQGTEPRAFVVQSVATGPGGDYVTVTFRSKESIEREHAEFAGQLAALARVTNEAVTE